MTATIAGAPEVPRTAEPTPTQLARRALDRVAEELRIARSDPALVAFAEAQTALDDARLATGEDSQRTRAARAQRAALRAAAETAADLVDRLQRRVGDVADELKNQELGDQAAAQGMRNAWARVRRQQEAADGYYKEWRRAILAVDTERAEFRRWQLEVRARTGIDPDGEVL